jgi:S1-C subfamily serine protease
MKLLKVAVALIILVGAVAIALRVVPLYGQSPQPGTRSRALEILGARGSEIGVSVRDVDEADVKREKLPSQSGAVIDEVKSDGPAAKAGILGGDVVVEFDGERVRSARQLTRLVQETPAGRPTKVAVVRDGRRVELQVTPNAGSGLAWLDGDFRPERLERFGRDFQFHMPEMPMLDGRGFSFDLRGSRARLGVSLSDLNPQLAGYFGVKEGVLVSSVEENSPAAAAGLKAGDVITAINGRAVRNASDVRQEVGNADETRDLSLTVVRDRKEIALKVTLQEVERRARRGRWTV